jgi:hypothetical protein
MYSKTSVNKGIIVHQTFNKIQKAALALALASASGLALAQAAPGGGGSTLGGLTAAQTAVTSVQTGLYSIVGVLAVIYLLYLGVMAFTEKKTWGDFGWGVVYVSCVGGSIALGTWAWGLFAS